MKALILKHGNIIDEVDFTDEVMGLDERAQFLIGRSQECHIILDDKMISRELAKLIYDSGKWSFKKLSSITNIKLNGEEISEKNIKNGDTLKVGDFTIEFQLEVEPIFEKSSSKKTNTSIQIDPVFADDLNSDYEIEKPLSEDISQKDDNIEMEPSIVNIGEFVSEQQENLYDDEEQVEPEQLSQENNFEDNNFEENNFEESLNSEDQNEMFDQYENQDYGDSSFALSELEDEKTGIISDFVKCQLEIFGEDAPYESFVLENGETFIGRNPEKCQIVLSDPEVSSVHAVVKRLGATCILEDLNSGNGTLYKGERINKVTLQNSDEFVIGGTTFTLKIGSDFLANEKDSLMPVEENQVIEIEEVVEVDPNLEEGFSEDNDDQEKSLFKKIWNNPEKRKKAIYALAFVVVAWVLLSEDEPKQTKKKAVATKEKMKKAKEESPFASLSPEKREKLESLYLLAKELIDSGRHTEALDHLTEVHKIIPAYKQSRQLEDVAKQSLAKIAELEKKKQEEIERRIKAEKVRKLVEKAEEEVKQRNVIVAESLFNQVLEIDPDNPDVPLLKAELDAWKREEERKRIEEAQRIAERKRMEDSLRPGKNYHLKKDWYRAILELEKFLEIKEMDEDLTQEGTKLLTESRENLQGIIDPMIGKARSLVEGQDLKGAYEVYKEILKQDPTHAESLNEINRIKELLTNRAKLVYREAILSESLSLFDEAKEKYQELQQIAPSDSEYYKKATFKLKDYIE